MAHRAAPRRSPGSREPPRRTIARPWAPDNRAPVGAGQPRARGRAPSAVALPRPANKPTREGGVRRRPSGQRGARLAGEGAGCELRPADAGGGVAGPPGLRRIPPAVPSQPQPRPNRRTIRPHRLRAARRRQGQPSEARSGGGRTRLRTYVRRVRRASDGTDRPSRQTRRPRLVRHEGWITCKALVAPPPLNSRTAPGPARSRRRRIRSSRHGPRGRAS
jgi:hypothetical protein